MADGTVKALCDAKNMSLKLVDEIARAPLFAERTATHSTAAARPPESVEALHCREPSRPDAPSNCSTFTIDQIRFDLPQQITGWSTPSRAHSRAYLVLLAQHRRQLEVMGK
jgi:hypothetical protein